MKNFREQNEIFAIRGLCSRLIHPSFPRPPEEFSSSSYRGLLRSLIVFHSRLRSSLIALRELGNIKFLSFSFGASLCKKLAGTAILHFRSSPLSGHPHHRGFLPRPRSSTGSPNRFLRGPVLPHATVSLRNLLPLPYTV